MRRTTGWLPLTLLAGALALAVSLAWLAARAAQAQRRATETALRDFTGIAAWQYARSGRVALTNVMIASSQRIIREFLQPMQLGSRRLLMLRVPTRLPDERLPRRVLAGEPCDCLDARQAITVFRVTPDSVFRSDGAALSEATRRALVAAALDDPGRPPRSWRIMPPGTPALASPEDVAVFWRVRLPAGAREQLEEPIAAVYGMIVPQAQIQRALARALTDASVLAPPILAHTREQTFLRVRVTGPDGTEVFAAGPDDAGSFAASDTIGLLVGALTATVSINIERATATLVPGPPGPAGGLIAAALVLTLLLTAGALVLLRREQQLVRLREDFVSGVSHELRTPLTQIRLHGELLMQDGFRSADERRRALAVIHRESLRMTNLVDNVLRFARLRRAASEPAAPAAPPPLVELRELAIEVGDLVQPLARERGASIVISAGDVAAGVDRDAVTRILLNFVENALKYGPAGQTVAIGVEPMQHGVRLTVEDQGPGIPPEERTRIWEPYYRLARDRNLPTGGSGLGLAVVAELVKELKGVCRVESGGSGGARFVVELAAEA